MCELLGMSANVPTDIVFSFSGLLERGGNTGPHKDGWGIAFYEGKACRTFHDPVACADSAIAELVKNYPIKSNIVISHIRLANSGQINLANTHPFTRELWGRRFTYAHNGQLKDIKKRELIHFQPIGTTDSEHAFCWIMDQLKKQFPIYPSAAKLKSHLYELCVDLNQLGVFNMLLSDASGLFAFCSTKLCWITRHAPFKQASLHDTEMHVDFGQETTPNDVVSVVATAPLTKNEEWQIMKPQQFIFIKNGKVSTHKSRSAKKSS